MFTGIVEELGTIAEVTDQGDAIRLTVEAATVLEGTGLGDSISVNGCCLTVSEIGEGRWTADLMQETLDKTSLAGWCPATGSTSSARSPSTSGSAATSSRATSTASARSSPARPASTGTSSRSRCPPHLARYLVDKGSITVDGVSLTVVEAREASFTVSLIPETLARTTLGTRRLGDLVNLEADVIAKHVEKLLAQRPRRPPPPPRTTRKN